MIMDVQEVASAFDRAYSDVKRQALLPGFRKGHAPRRILERKFGEDVKNDVRSQLFSKGLMDALKQKGLVPLGEPSININDIQAEPGEKFCFIAEIDVRPTFALSEYKGISLTEKVVEVKASELDERLSALQANFGENKETEGAAVAGCIVEGDLLFKVGEEEIFKQSGRAVRLDGTQIFGVEVGDVATHLTGSRTGDDKVIRFVISDEYPRAELRGKNAVITLHVTKVLNVELPKLDDAFAARLGMDNIEKLREQLRISMEGERKAEARRELEEELTTALIASHSFELPQALLDRQTESVLRQQRYNLMRMGATKDALGDQEEELKAESSRIAKRQLQRMMIVDAIGEKEGIKVEEVDIRRHLQMLAHNYGVTMDQLVKDIQQRNGIGDLQEEIRDIKVTQFLLDQAKITTQTIESAVK